MDSLAILKNKSHDLKHVDLNIVKTQFLAIDQLEDSAKKFAQLAELCAYKTIVHPEWAVLAGRVKLMELQLHTGKTFSETTEKAKTLLNEKYYRFVKDFANVLDHIIIESRNDTIDWFGICTGIKSYFLKVNKLPVEDPQQMFLRVAVWLHMPNIDKIKETYDDLSLHNYMHATPTLFNSGLRRAQLSSCFLLTIGDSMEHISKSWHDIAMISKNSGGIGLDISDIRHSEIGSSSDSSGVVPMLKVHNSILNYVDQGGKRRGSATIYISDHHIDILEFLELKKNSGSESMRARDLFYALWVSDLFMRRVEKDEMWSLFCPHQAPGLNNCWGEEFEKLYLKYEEEKLYKKQISARSLWQAIFVSWVEVGMPFILFKDSVNRKSNQQNLGTIRCSNLCVEIVQYTSKDEIANCNLANIVLKSCVKTLHSNGRKKHSYDFTKLERLSRALVRNLNNVIDKNYYPPEVPQIKNSNLLHRPMGIGVQGLADTFAMMDIAWESDEAKQLNLLIFETIYYAAVSESIKIAKERQHEKTRTLTALKQEWKSLIDSEDNIAKRQAEILEHIKQANDIVTTYSSYEGSPASKGLLQFDMWGESRNLSGKYDWDIVRRDLAKYGMRNSLLIALMPTASTAHLIGNNEAFEPFTNLIGARTVLSGQFMLVNKYMVSDFQDLGVWGRDIANDIVRDDGSMQSLNIKDYIERPTEEQLDRFEFLKKKYKTAYELSQKVTADLAIDRGRFVCQTQSFNCFIKEPNYQGMTSYMFHQWRNGAKTGMYYLRSAPPANPMKFAIGAKKSKKEVIQKYICEEDVCIMCQ